MTEHRGAILTDAEARGFISDLTYLNYQHNRSLAPHVTPEQWAKVYGPDTPKMEEKFQKEMTARFDALLQEAANHENKT